MSFEGVILDFDGTLCDSSNVHKIAFIEATKNFGYTWCNTKEKEYNKNKNLKTIFKLKNFANLGLIEAKHINEINELKQSLMKQKIHLLKIDEKVSNFLKSLINKKIFIASDADKETILSVLKFNKIENIFQEVITSKDVGLSCKPSPDIYLKCLERMNLNPKDIVVFEDTEEGLISAKKAGIFNVHLCTCKTLYDILKKIND